MAQVTPYFKPQGDRQCITYRPDPDDADDVHVVGKMKTRQNMGYYIEAVVLVVEDSTYATVNAYKIAGTFMNDGGTLTQVGSTAALVTNETDAGWSCTYAVDDTNDEVQVQLTLDASHTSSAPIIVRSKLTECLELGQYSPHFYGDSDNNP